MSVAASPAVARPRRERRHEPQGLAGRFGSWALNLWAVLGFVYLFAPIAVIVLFSFNDPVGKFNFTWQGFTFDNWLHPFIEEDLVDAFVRSIEVAVLATALATIFGTLIALALVRYRFRGGALTNLLLVLPLTTPEIVLGASLMTLFLDPPLPHSALAWSWGDTRGFRTIVIAHVMFCVSFVALTVKARVRGFDWTLEDAAMDLGAPPFRTFSRVTLPLIAPGILAAGLLSLALSIDDFIITLFVAGDTKTFPIQVFAASRVEVRPQVNVLATILLVVSIAALLGATVRRGRESV